MTDKVAEGASTFEGFDGRSGVDGEVHPADESMRVMYEDPGERDEKKRLMSLLGNHVEVEQREVGTGVGRKRPLVRRSVRVAGF